METSDILKKVRKIEIKTRGISNQIFSGEYHSAFKGRGMAFSEVREYIPGDEIRTIDWKVTARFNTPYVKVFEEERELTVMLLVDLSGSERFGSKVQLKQDLITEICAVLAFSAIQNNDKTGVIFFSDRVEKFIPPKKGKKHILHIIRELLDFKPAHPGTNISEALRYFNNIVKKRSIAFLISDFIDEGYEDALKIARRKHDMVALRIYDQNEEELPNVGVVEMIDPETNETAWINTSSKEVRKQYARAAQQRKRDLQELLRRCGVDHAMIGTHQSYIKPLMNLFKNREA